MPEIVKRKRIRTISAKPGELKAAWGRCDGDVSIVYAYGGAGASKPDARILSCALEEMHVHNGKNLIAELEARGYDISTLKFSVKMKAKD